ncbi:MAG: ABC transporter ATP-binding protein [Dehalococcoidia bacterium]|nr:ABC transporter ATP-binding protein [Dehalococcoidia bacterium]
MSVVEIRDLTKIYSNSQIALNDINFKILEGEILGIAGPINSGKSSLLKIIAKRDKPTSGQLVYSESINLGYFSATTILPQKTRVFEFLVTVAKMHNLDLPNDYSKIIKLLTAFELNELSNYKIVELSFFQQRSLAISAALIANPNLLILDEPFLNLDNHHVEKLTNFLKLFFNRNLSCVIAAVNLDQIEPIATSVGLLFAGNIIHKSDILTFSRLAGRNIIEIMATGNLAKFEERLSFLELQKELAFERNGSIFRVTFFQSRELEDCFFLLSDLIKRLGLSVSNMSSVAASVDIQLVDLVQGRLQLGKPHFQSLLDNIDALENSLDNE